MFHSHFTRRLCTAMAVAALMIGVIRSASHAAGPDELLLAARASVTADSDGPRADASDAAMDGATSVATDEDFDALLDLTAEGDVKQLTEVEVFAPALQEVVWIVFRQKSTVGRSPAAVFVITNEMIRRSGARTVPEVLRMASGVQVMKIDSNKWAISIRGFASRFASSLLVQIDGRSVYSPLYADVFWNVQDLLLEDVERIEVIRGPGATVWGAKPISLPAWMQRMCRRKSTVVWRCDIGRISSCTARCQLRCVLS